MEGPFFFTSPLDSGEVGEDSSWEHVRWNQLEAWDGWGYHFHPGYLMVCETCGFNDLHGVKPLHRGVS